MTRVGSFRLLGLALAASVAGMMGACRFEPGTVYRCEESGRCEPGYACIDGYCLPETPFDGDVGFDGGTDGGDGGHGGEDGGADGGRDGGGPRYGIPETWAVLHPVTELNTPFNERAPTVTADLLTLCYQSDEAGDFDIYCTVRDNPDASFSPPLKQPLSLTGVQDQNPELNADGTELFFSSQNGADEEDIFRAVPDVNGEFAGRELQTSLVAPGFDLAPSLSSDGLTMYFQSDRVYANSGDIWVATRPDAGSPWSSEVTHLGEVAAKEREREPGISPDGKYLLYTSDRDAGAGVTGPLIYLSERNRDGGFGPGRPVWIQGVESSILGVELAPDETLFFSADDGVNGYQLYVAKPVYDAGQ